MPLLTVLAYSSELQFLSFVSPMFNTMFTGDFREKNQEEVPVNVDGTHAEHFEAFLHCVYPYGAKPRGMRP